MKDAFYFPHFCNARHDRKIMRLRKELGIEGYGIFFMLLEILRDQIDFKYPLTDIDLLATEFGTSEQKVRTVICNYHLFEVDDVEQFFSPKLIVYLQPYLRMKEQRRLAGIKSGEARREKQESFNGCSADDQRYLNENEQNKVNETNETNENKNNKTNENDNDNDNEVSYHDSHNDTYHDSSNIDVKPKKEKNNKKESKKEKSFDELINEYTENDFLKEAILNYIKMRIAKKARPTNNALELIFKDLDEYSRYDDDIKIKILERSIKNNWTGVFEIKENGQAQNNFTPRPEKKSFLSMLQEVYDENLEEEEKIKNEKV